MKLRWSLAVLLAAAAIAQVAERANEGYQTRESRRRVARWLDSTHRDELVKPRELVAALKLAPGMTVVDLGTGAGFLLPYLSEAVGPSGKVLAQDIHPDFLDLARRKIEARKLSNVEFVLGTETDVNLPRRIADVVVTLDTYHHFNYPERMLEGIRGTLKAGGRLVVVDYYKAYFRDPDHVRLEDVEVVKEIEANGFRLVYRRDHIPRSQYLLVFRRK